MDCKTGGGTVFTIVQFWLTESGHNASGLVCFQRWETRKKSARGLEPEALFTLAYLFTSSAVLSKELIN